MIDDPETAERRLAKPAAAWPLPARLTPALQASLQEPGARAAIPTSCSRIKRLNRQHR